MKLITHNPYRIAGILSNATERELQKQKTKIKAYSKVGKEIKSDFDFQILESIHRTENSVTKAFSNVEQNQDKVNYALFWFLNASPFDNTAIEYLKNSDEEKALEIWEKVTTDKDVNTRNFSSFNNLGTYKLLSKSKRDIKAGIEAKIKLIESEHFESFVHSVADETFTIDNQKQSEKLIDELLTQFNGQYSNSETLKLFSGCNGTTQKYLSKKLTEEPLQKIESKIESCKKKRKADNGKAYEYGLNLYNNTKEDLSLLKSLLSRTNLKYKSIADQLANEIIQCGIDYFNESQENESSDNYLESAQKLTKLAVSVAVGSLIKGRAKDQHKALEEMKDQLLHQVVAFLKTVKQGYEQNKFKIRKQIEELKRNDIDFKLGYKTINQSAVDENIKNSIDWDKVNDLLKEFLAFESLVKIKSSSKIQLKSEFLELAYWLKEHSQSYIIITNILTKYKKIPPKLSFKIISSEITNTDNKPLFNKYIRYIGLNLKVEVIEKSDIKFYLKYISPYGRVRRNSKSSPIGYTKSEDIYINKNSNEISFSGWGSEDECTYELGDHYIEVYIDEYLIHTKKFNVDLAPSEKIEKDLANCERKLREINGKAYYESEIVNLQNKMNEIQKFKFFRGKSEKQRQIQTTQKKIDSLIEKAKDERSKDISNQEEKIYKLKINLSKAKY